MPEVAHLFLRFLITLGHEGLQTIAEDEVTEDRWKCDDQP